MALTPWYLWQLAELTAATTVGASNLSPPIVRLLDRSNVSAGVALVIWHEDEWTGPADQWCGALTEALRTWALPDPAKKRTPGPFEEAASSALTQSRRPLVAGAGKGPSSPVGKRAQPTAMASTVLPTPQGPAEDPWWRMPEVDHTDLTDEQLDALLASLPGCFEEADAAACIRSSQEALSRRVAIAHIEVLVKQSQWKALYEACFASLTKQVLLQRRAREDLILAARQLLELHRQVDQIVGRH